MTIVDRTSSSGGNSRQLKFRMHRAAAARIALAGQIIEELPPCRVHPTLTMAARHQTAQVNIVDRLLRPARIPVIFRDPHTLVISIIITG
ncbi:hypothetical protein GCM10023157_06080 [Gluconacetobacter asukensis]